MRIEFHHGDIRTSKLGRFDVVIAMFNAIGHLTKKDFDKAIKNVSSNLKDGGLFIFDIENLDYKKIQTLSKNKCVDAAFCITPENNICTITDGGSLKGIKFVRFIKSNLDVKSGIITEHWETTIQKDSNDSMVYLETWEKQTYSADQLTRILAQNFKVVEFCDINGTTFTKDKSHSICTVAKKK